MQNLSGKEKIELLKNTIYYLYSKEGRSKTYISKVLEINRNLLCEKLEEWKFEEAPPKHHLTPSNQKFLNKNRILIKSLLDQNTRITEIARQLGVSNDYLQKTIIPNDEVLKKAREDYSNRVRANRQVRINVAKERSSLVHDPADLDGEIWKPILGYERYLISNLGRVKSYSKTYNSYYLITPTNNVNNDRPYVMLYGENGKRNLQLSRLVAHSFVEGFDEHHNTVNHKDGDVTNCNASNLEWVSQAENNLHAYRALNRKPVNSRRYNFKKIIYNDKYEFKTIIAFAKFLNVSESCIRYRIDNNPEKYNIKLIK